MSDTQAAMREFRFLDDKRKTSGLTQAEEQHWQELGIQLQMPIGYYAADGNWYPYPPGYDAQSFAAWQAQQQAAYYPPAPSYPQPGYYDPNQQVAYPGYPPQQPQPQWDPNTQTWYYPQAQGYDPNQPYYPPQTQWPQPSAPPAPWSAYPPQEPPAPEPFAEAPAAEEPPAQDAPAEDAPLEDAPLEDNAWESRLGAETAPATEGAMEVGEEEVMEVTDEDVTLLDPTPPAKNVQSPLATVSSVAFEAEPPLTSAVSVGIQPEPPLTAVDEEPVLDSGASFELEVPTEKPVSAASALPAPEADDDFSDIDVSDQTLRTPIVDAAPGETAAVEAAALEAPLVEPEAEPIAEAAAVIEAEPLVDAGPMIDAEPAAEPIVDAVATEDFDAPLIEASAQVPSVTVPSVTVPSVALDALDDLPPPTQALPKREFENEPTPAPAPDTAVSDPLASTHTERIPAATEPAVERVGDGTQRQMPAFSDTQVSGETQRQMPAFSETPAVSDVTQRNMPAFVEAPSAATELNLPAIDDDGPLSSGETQRAMPVPTTEQNVMPSEPAWDVTELTPTQQNAVPATEPAWDAAPATDQNLVPAAEPAWDAAPATDQNPVPAVEPAWDATASTDENPVPAAEPAWDAVEAPTIAEPESAPAPSSGVPSTWELSEAARTEQQIASEPAWDSIPLASEGPPPTARASAAAPWDSSPNLPPVVSADPTWEISRSPSLDNVPPILLDPARLPPALPEEVPAEEIDVAAEEEEAEEIDVAEALPAAAARPPPPPPPSAPTPGFSSGEFPPMAEITVRPPPPPPPSAPGPGFTAGAFPDFGTPPAAPQPPDLMPDFASAPVEVVDSSAPAMDFDVSMDDRALPVEEELTLSGAASDQVDLASNADFITAQRSEAVDDSPIDLQEDPGEFEVDNAPMASLANEKSTALAADPVDEAPVPLANNADFIGSPELSAAGEQWTRTDRSVGFEGESVEISMEPTAQQKAISLPPAEAPPEDDGDIIQGVVLEEPDSEPAVAVTLPPEEPAWEVEVTPSEPVQPVLRAPPPPPAPTRVVTPAAPPKPPPVAARPPPPPRPALPPRAPLEEAIGAELAEDFIPAPPAITPVSTVPRPPPGRGGPDRSMFGSSFNAQTTQAISVPGESLIILHTLEGQVKRGALRDADLAEETITIENAPNPAEKVPRQRVKAIFFRSVPGMPALPPTGVKVRVTFKDGRQLSGFSGDHADGNVGFFVIPADNRTNTSRIFIYRHSVDTVVVD